MSQIQKPLPGRMRHIDWAGTKGEDEGEDDKINKNGTDYSGGMSKSHEDAAQDKDLFRKLLKDERDPNSDDDMEKSFLRFVEDNPVIVQGVRASPFLKQVVKSIGASFDALQHGVGHTLSACNQDHAEFAKSLDGAFNSIGGQLGLIDQTAQNLEKSQTAEPSAQNVQVHERTGGQPMQKSFGEVMNALVKGVQDGTVSPLAAIRYETTRQLDPAVAQRLGIA